MIVDDRTLPALAANRAIPLDLLLHLIEHADPEHIVRGLRLRWDLPDAAVEAMAAHPHPALRRAAAEMPNLSDTALIRLVREQAGSMRLPVLEQALNGRVLPDAAYAALAADTGRLMRQEFARLPAIPAHIAALLADDPEHGDLVLLHHGTPAAADAAYLRLLTHPDPERRGAALRIPGRTPPTPLLDDLMADPATRARAIPHVTLGAEPAERLAADADDDVRAALAETADVPAGVLARLAADPAARVRAAAAGNAALPPELREQLAADDDRRVRHAVVYGEHTPDQVRDRVHYPLGRHEHAATAWWLRDRCDDLALQQRHARSAQAALRRTVALCSHLDTATVELLADDEDFIVRLLLAETHPDAPPRLLVRVVQEWTGYSVAGLMRHPNFPAGAIDAFSRSVDRRLRWCAVYSGRLTSEQVARLRDDPDPALRLAVAADTWTATEAVAMLASPDQDVRERAAAHRELPVAVMRQLAHLALRH